MADELVIEGWSVFDGHATHLAIDIGGTPHPAYAEFKDGRVQAGAGPDNEAVRVPVEVLLAMLPGHVLEAELIRRMVNHDRDAHQKGLAKMSHGAIRMAIDRKVLADALTLMESKSLADLIGSIAAKIPEFANKIAEVKEDTRFGEATTKRPPPRLRVLDRSDDEP